MTALEAKKISESVDKLQIELDGLFIEIKRAANKGFTRIMCNPTKEAVEYLESIGYKKSRNGHFILITW